ncbi:uncharacterized protein LOC107823536 isoform X2 [Nicotiana tabacum]|uniref:Uncharacterized protein LOC107823536 isoform X2 n=1 Tax=Nicotiana tabacum TaxID=4097 RepID=A0A1S4CXF3_TOBAC|nr:PREDICTED: uncharacterized protein LOC107823536 isoform X2 [Nicotiana tabacum]
MVMIMMHQHHHHHHHQSTAPSPHPINPTPPPTLRSPNTATTQFPSPSPLSLGRDHVIGPPGVELGLPPLARVKLSDIAPYDGAPVGPYLRAVEALSGSLMRHNAAVIELGSEGTAVLRCGLESVRYFFKTRAVAQNGGAGTGSKSGRGVYIYRAGRPLEDMDSSPPCMTEVFRCMGRAARASLSAIARHLRLRSDVFDHLLDDNPLPINEASSSVLVATFSSTTSQNGKGAIGGGKQVTNGEVEKGLLTLISSDASGLQVCDPNGRWYLADSGLSPGDLLLLTGKALSHATAGLRPAALYRGAADNYVGTACGGRTSLAFRLIPQSNAILDCSPIAAAGHVIPQSYVPISVSQFMDDLSAEEDMLSNTDNAYVTRDNLNKEPSLRSVLSDPLSGAFLEDAMFVSCGHSFGGLMLKRVIDMARCTLCNAEIERGSLIPNLVLRAAAAAVKHEDDRRLFHNAALRKRRKEVGDNRENGEVPSENGPHKGVQYPYSVNEKVVIRGNRRTPDKFVGKEAVITSQCLNGWYLLKIIDSGENVRLQYRSLRKIGPSQEADERCQSQTVQNSS